MPVPDWPEPAWLPLPKVGEITWIRPIPVGRFVRYRVITTGRNDFSRWLGPIALQVARENLSD